MQWLFLKKLEEKLYWSLYLITSSINIKKYLWLGKLSFNTLLFWIWVVCRNQCIIQKFKVAGRDPSCFGTITGQETHARGSLLEFYLTKPFIIIYNLDVMKRLSFCFLIFHMLYFFMRIKLNSLMHNVPKWLDTL